jgi:hypothetical protein
MRIEVIKTYEAFSKLEDDWEAVYAADPEAQFFLSWTWLSVWLKGTPKWYVLVARLDASSPPVAFFPIRLRITTTPAGEVINEVAMAGNRAADYTGFICRPECDDTAILAFAACIRTIKWDHFHLENLLLSQKRMNRFLSFFGPDNFQLKSIRITNKNQDVDNYKCPYVTLPACWDTYLNDSLGTNTRQKVRRFLKKVDGSGELRISCATASTIDRDLDCLLHLWTQNWGHRKQPAELERIQRTHKEILMQCFDAGVLFVPVIWQGEAPVGALAVLVDNEKKSLLFYIGGRDAAQKNPPPGFILHAYSLRFAINNGFRIYDFLRGNEPYKYLFASEERQIRHIVVSARSAQPSAANAPVADAQSTPAHQPA